MRYSTIVADPPWPYRGGGPVGCIKKDGTPSIQVNAREKYSLMSLKDICALRPPVADDAHLYLWTTNSFLVQAHEVARAWGFDVKTCITWVKVKATDPSVPSMKTGYYFRGATEHCLFAVRGSLPLLVSTPAFSTAFMHPRLPHSMKPEGFYTMVEQVSPGPRLEMFARLDREGWDRWGNEVDSNTSVPSVVNFG